MKSTLSGRRSVGAAVAITLTGTLALSGCGTAGVMHDGKVAAKYQDVTVTNTQVQDALADIKKAAPTANFDSLSAIVFMVLSPQMRSIASKYGIAVSTSAARAQFKGFTPSDAAVTTAQSSMIYGGMQSSPQAANAFASLLKSSAVELNPRYGTWRKGAGPALPKVDWIKSASPTSAATPAQ